MPTVLRDILKNYSEQELEKLAKDKIDDFEHLRLPKTVLIEELSTHLVSPSYIYDSVSFRSPPTFEILNLLLNSRGYEVPISGFRKTVLENTKELIEQAKNGEFLSKGQNFSLYLKILKSAWESNESIERAEAKLLESLREELGITFKEHCILNHHPDINYYWNERNPFQRERNYLLQAGIIYIDDKADTYVLPEEIAYKILSLWQVELDDFDYQRLLSHLTNDGLSFILDHFNLKVSGRKEELVERIIQNYIPARDALDLLQKQELSDLCKEINCKSSGLKQEVIDRLITNFRSDVDLLEEEVEEPEVLVEEEKELDIKDFKKLFNVFTTNELQYLLAQVPTLVTYGLKDEKIDRLWTGPYSERSLLELLNKRELKEACKEFNLLISGRKEDLIDRIIKHFDETVGYVNGIEEELEQRKEKSGDKSQDTEKEHTKEEIPNFDKVREQFDYLDDNQQVILGSLIEFKSLNEQDIDRIVARYDLGWLFYKPEMSRLKELLAEHDTDLIEKHSFGESDRYDLRYEQNIFE